MSENKLNVYQRLAAVREIVPYLKKEQKGAQYSYVGSSDVLGSLHAKINEVGLILVPEITGHKLTPDVEEIPDKYNKELMKKRTTYFTELDMTMTWVNIDDPSDNCSVAWYAQGVDIAGEKGVGKALTYGEKYFLLKFFNIATDKDDPDAFQNKVDSKIPAKKITATQAKVLEALVEKVSEASNGVAKKEALMTKLKVNDFTILTVDEYGNILNQLNAWKQAYEKKAKENKAAATPKKEIPQQEEQETMLDRYGNPK